MDIAVSTKKMVISPRARRRVLEVKLKEKNQELRELCIREAELIGVLPPETPIEPGESPPSFTPKTSLFMKAVENSRKMTGSTSGNFQAKEEDLVNLEQECRKQCGIAEAAFGLANDVSISKSLRRKHRLMYQHSQHRINELETRINLVKRTSNLSLNRSKAVMYDSRDDQIGIPITDEVDQPHSLAVERSSSPHYQRNFAPSVPKHQIQWAGHYNHPDSIHPVIQQKAPMTQQHFNFNHLATMHATQSYDVPKSESVYNSVSSSHPTLTTTKSNNINILYAHQPAHNEFHQQDDLKRFGSIDRRRVHYNPIPPPRPPNKQKPEDVTSFPKPFKTLEPDTVLLPNQMYPDNAIMRAQSLSNVRYASDTQLPITHHVSVPWYDPPPPPPNNLSINTLGPPSNNVNNVDNLVYQKNSSTNQTPDNLAYQKSPTTTQTPEPTVIVPYVSPQNQTVIQVGKFQPYREISKPFEMSDFYKYSTKFRRKPGDPGTNSMSKTKENTPNSPE